MTTPTPAATHGITAECRVYLDDDLNLRAQGERIKAGAS